jgi:hypothetical protein
MYEGPVHNNSVGGKMLRDEKPDKWKPLYTTPPAAPVPLTDEQRSKMYRTAVLRGDSIMVRGDYELGISDAEAAHNITKGGTA